jgi:hypothetical protein
VTLCTDTFLCPAVVVRVMTRRQSDSGVEPPESENEGGVADDQSVDALVSALEATLRETEELPVAPASSVWLGEAHAVAADLAREPVDEEVLRERVGHVHRLLSSAGDVDNDAAASSVADAVEIAATILDRTGDDPGGGPA